MTLKHVQEQVDEWAQQFKTPYWQPLEIMARMTEEMGELAREINHRYGPKKKKPSEQTREVADELADLIVTITCMANSLGINLDECVDRTINKLHDRDTQRFEKKEE
ncbi:MAG: nucleotide pyrophosphohydrolase [DPANN group archaeon]|nr:nucleotide pyrophosphohydrolase [DPANN group archaeon]